MEFVRVSQRSELASASLSQSSAPLVTIPIAVNGVCLFNDPSQNHNPADNGAANVPTLDQYLVRNEIRGSRRCCRIPTYRRMADTGRRNDRMIDIHELR